MSETELREAFEGRKPALAALGNFVKATIISDLEVQLGSSALVDKFFQIPPKPRVKETDSFLEKALFRKKKADPLLEITDQVGVRFVVLLLEDIDTLGKIIKSDRWDWSKDRDHEKERLEKPDYFAYQSDHYVIRTKSDMEYGGVAIEAKTPCEIQVRTILQHAYAEMAHSSDYKPSVRLPEADQKKVKRALAKGSALIETTDDVFKEIRERLTEYGRSVDALLAKSSEIYADLTGEARSAPTAWAILIADTYRKLLDGVTPEQLTKWGQDHSWLAETLKAKRSESFFYRDPVLILLGWLVTENQTAVPKDWPADSSYLEDFYVALGISPQGLF